MKGGLRWPLGKASSGNRYGVVGVWHTKAKTYKNSLVRLRVRDADRFDFRTSEGEVTKEITLKMTGLVSQLRVSTLLGFCNPIACLFTGERGYVDSCFLRVRIKCYPSDFYGLKIP